MINQVQRMASFSHPLHGGNPAGVVLLEHEASSDEMLKTAAEVGYSETAFLWPGVNGWVVRYFSPRIEVPFCGHATVAAAACLAQRLGEGAFDFSTPVGDVKTRAWREHGNWYAGFVSRPTRSEQLSTPVLTDLLSVLELTKADLDESLAPAMIHAGGNHALLALRSRTRLSRLSYPFEVLARVQEDQGWTTVAVVFQDESGVIHARNLFAVGGVVEDPATGAAAAALAGHLRDSGAWEGGRLTILQGEDMGQPCLIYVDAETTRHMGVTVSGLVRRLAEERPSGGAKHPGQVRLV